MSYTDDIKARLNVTGNSISESQFNTTSNYIKSTFKDSPFYKIVKVNGADTEVRVMDVTSTVKGGKIEPIRFDNKYLLFLPKTTINIGDVVEFDNRTWIITDVQLNELYPSAKIGQCNYKLKYQIGVTKVKTGVDAMGRPTYTETPTYVDPLQPCIINTQIQSVGLNADVNLPKERLIITLTYNSNSKLIKENDVLNINNRNYKVTHFNYTHVINEVGILDVYADRIV